MKYEGKIELRIESSKNAQVEQAENKEESDTCESLKIYVSSVFINQDDNDYFCRKSHVSDVRVQLNAFDYQQEADEELTNHGPPGIDLSSHVDVFYAILGQVSDLRRFS